MEKLGNFLPGTDEVYGSGTTKIAKDFLVSKGLGSASTDTSAVATKLVTEKATELGTAILGVKKDVGGTLKPALETDLAANANFQTSVAGNSALKTAVAADQEFREAVASNLASPADIAALPALQDAVAGKKVLQDAVAAVPALKTAVAADADLQDAVKSALAGDGTFKSAVKVAVNAEEIREVMSQPVLDIPTDPNAPLSWDW